MTRSHSQVVNRWSITTLALALLVPSLARADRSVAVDVPPVGGGIIGSPSLGPSVGRMSYSGLVGLELAPSDFAVGPRFTAEGMYGFMDLAPQLRLDLGGRVAFGYHGGPANTDTSMWLLDFVPDAKLRYAVMDELGVYGDVGIGLAVINVNAPSVVVNNVSYGGTTDIALTFQFGGGVAYAITPNINLLGEIRFDFYTKSGAGTFITVPAVGIEFH